MIAELREIAWQFWKDQITERGTDRREVLRRLAALTAEESSFRNPYNDWLLRCLELTVAPRESKPGTIEALIDDLTEYWDNPFGNSNPGEQAPYRKLVELGFEAADRRK